MSDNFPFKICEIKIELCARGSLKMVFIIVFLFNHIYLIVHSLTVLYNYYKIKKNYNEIEASSLVFKKAVSLKIILTNV